MSNRNLSIWSANADIDPKHTKPISGKDYKGTSPDPHEIIRMMTKQFGPVGKGFGWNVLESDFQPLGEGVILHWVRINFWWTEDGSRHEFEAFGQTKAAYVAGKGDGRYVRTDEDAPKKSLTDAITKAAAQLGFAANIYLGLFDDNKYVEGLEAKFRWKEEHERDSAFWDRVYDALPEDPSPEAVAQTAASEIWEKVSGYKTADSVNKYLRTHKARFSFIEVHGPEWFEQLRKDISDHREKLAA